MGNLPVQKEPEILQEEPVIAFDDILDAKPIKEVEIIYKEIGKILNTSFDEGITLVDNSREFSVCGYYEE
jgi:hypothetical protein